MASKKAEVGAVGLELIAFDAEERGLGHLATDRIDEPLGIGIPPWVHLGVVGRGGGDEVEGLARFVAAFEDGPAVETRIVTTAGRVEEDGR
jgi:hypothetical protein